MKTKQSKLKKLINELDKSEKEALNCIDGRDPETFDLIEFYGFQLERINVISSIIKELVKEVCQDDERRYDG